MPRKPRKPSATPAGLMITRTSDGVLSPAQLEFNRLMKRLESARAKQLREQARLDELLVISIRDLMPLIDDLHRANRDIVFHASDALKEIKFSDKRRRWLKSLVSGKATDLLEDSCGLTPEDLVRLKEIIAELEPPHSKKRAQQEAMDDADDDAEDFEFMRAMLEKVARESGMDLDLSDMDPGMHPADFEREMAERFQAAAERSGTTTSKRPRKQTKAQIERARKLQEQEDAKKQDFKSLYKQLAKALHPDLEPDPELKLHKETWMKRLTGAYAAGDLRELLQIEMEWLGEEATNLASASDHKLMIYCDVLKQQISDLKRQTDGLLREPQYGPLQRFIHPFFGGMPKPAKIRSELRADLLRHREMLETLTQREVHRTKMMEQWADTHGRALRQTDIPF